MFGRKSRAAQSTDIQMYARKRIFQQGLFFFFLFEVIKSVMTIITSLIAYSDRCHDAHMDILFDEGCAFNYGHPGVLS